MQVYQVLDHLLDRLGLVNSSPCKNLGYKPSRFYLTQMLHIPDNPSSRYWNESSKQTHTESIPPESTQSNQCRGFKGMITIKVYNSTHTPSHSHSHSHEQVHPCIHAKLETHMKITLIRKKNELCTKSYKGVDKSHKSPRVQDKNKPRANAKNVPLDRHPRCAHRRTKGHPQDIGKDNNIRERARNSQLTDRRWYHGTMLCSSR